MNLSEISSVALAVIPGIAWAVFGYAALDDALDLGLVARAKGIKTLFNVSVVAQILARDYGTSEALVVAGAAFAAALTATGSVQKAAFYGLAAGAARELPNLKADVLSKAILLLTPPAKPASPPPPVPAPIPAPVAPAA